MFKGKITQDDFIEKSRCLHGDKYDYSSVIYLHYRGKVNIICKIHGLFTQTASDHLAGNGCQSCAQEYRNLIKFNKYSSVFISKAVAIHGDTYDYSKTIYKAAKINVLVICKKHGAFSITPNRHLNGGGCPSCKFEKLRKLYQLSTEDFIKRSIDIHRDRYDYSLVDYVNAHRKVVIICKIHGEFSQEPNSHLHGNGCPFCKISHGESKIENILIDNNITHCREKTFPDCRIVLPMKFDFFIPSYNLIIEYHGEQHFIDRDFFGGISALMKLKRNDEYKKRWAIENGYIFKEYTYKDSWDFIEKDIKKLLKQKIS